jgi:SAM-dependent methyltransferase
MLEVGCGGGDLALRLAGAGHDVLAIDPEAPDGAIFRRVTLEELDDPGPFDAAVASRSLHHIHDLDGGLDRIVALLTPRGRLVVVEHAFERLDEPTAEWYLARRRELERTGGGHGHPAPGSLEACRDEWDREHAHLHRSDAMLEALDERFEQLLLEWGPYLFEELGGVASAAEERRLIDQGRIQAMGFRYVGEARIAD